MPNIFAYCALAAWPLISLLMFRNFHVITAVFLTIVGGYLILPVNVAFDYPLIPPLDQESIPALSALFGCMFMYRKKIHLIPNKGLERWLVLGLLIAPIFTVLTNQESVVVGSQFIPGLNYNDVLSSMIIQYLGLIPFFLAFQLIRTESDQVRLFKLFVIAGLAYSFLILLEIRLSPQFHNWVYGFFPHKFGQQMRQGGFRAVVFMGHGLLVAMFVVVSLSAATVLWKERISTLQLPPFILIIYLLVLLVLCKSLGALVLGSFFVIAVAFMPVRILKNIAISITFIILLYPALSLFDLFPHQQIVDIASAISPDRAQSLEFRFRNEGELLDHAEKKLALGWGSWGRNRLENSVTDGYWVIKLSANGIIGFLLIFGLALLGVFRGLRSSKFVKTAQSQRLLVGHILLVSVIMLDQIPNASMASWTWLICGALLGRATHVVAERKTAGMLKQTHRPFAAKTQAPAYPLLHKQQRS